MRRPTLIAIALAAAAAPVNAQVARFGIRSDAPDRHTIYVNLVGTTAIDSTELSVRLERADLWRSPGLPAGDSVRLGALVVQLSDTLPNGAWTVYAESPPQVVNRWLHAGDTVHLAPLLTHLRWPHGIDPSHAWITFEVDRNFFNVIGPVDTTWFVQEHHHTHVDMFGHFLPASVRFGGPYQAPALIAGTCGPLPVYSSSRAMVQYAVDTTGRVDSASIRVHWATDSAAVRAALASLPSCRYEPGRVGGYLVRAGIARSLGW